MTREESIAILDTVQTIGDQVDALEMAIEALKNENALIDRVLEIIEQGKRHCQSQFTSRMEDPTLAAVEGLADRFRDEILALKGDKE